MMSHYFPEEILIEILTRLPVKSLCRFTLVSKSWNEFITSQTFISNHLQKSSSEIIFRSILVRRFFRYANDHYTLIRGFGTHSQSSEIIFSHGSGEGYFRIVGSSNGLLCFVPDLFDGVDKVVLWNPSISRSFHLPRASVRPSWPHLAVFGMGVDSATADCKVVRIVLARINQYLGFARLQSPEAEVYSLKTNSWKQLVEPDIRCRIMQFSWTPVMLQACPHWLAYRRRENGLKNLVLTFDMSSEVFREIMVPDDLGRGNRVKLCPNLFRDTLTLVKYNVAPNVWTCNIWVMKEYGVFETWTTIYTFDLIGGMERIIGFQEEEGVLFATRAGNELVLYDLKTATIKNIGIVGFSSSFHVNRYIESLILLKNGVLE